MGVTIFLVTSAQCVLMVSETGIVLQKRHNQESSGNYVR